MLRFTAFLFLFCFCLAACSSSETVDDAPLVFFSLKNYIKAEAERLEARAMKVDKTITINGKEEQQLVSITDFAKELTFFSNADINKLAWADKYQTDSTLHRRGQLASLHYQAIDPALKTQKIHLYFDPQNKLDSLRVSTNSQTALSGNANELYYNPKQGYRINTQQTNRAADPVVISINSLFVEGK